MISSVTQTGPRIRGADVHGGGVIVKILDAVAAGVPVVTTTIGNEGIGGTDGVHLLAADTPWAFADQVMKLLTDEELWDRIAREARAFVSERFSLDAMMSTLHDTYEGVCRSGVR